MSTEERDRWGTERIVASMWWCGDEWCNCWQPVVERITPNLRAGYPWITREQLWAGSFHSEPTAAEDVEMNTELDAARERFGIS